MKKTFALLTTLAIATTALFGAGIASAQARPYPSRDDRGRQSAQAPRARLVEKTGTIASFVFGRGRGVRGVVLGDGSLVMLQGNDASLRHARPGQAVRVRGQSVDGHTIRNAQITLLRQAPAARTVTTRGIIRSFRTGPDGLPQTLVLTNGKSISIPATLARSLARHGLRTGERIAVIGHTTSARPNSTVVADSITFANGSIVYAANPGHGR